MPSKSAFQDVKIEDVKVNVIIFGFDLLELNGKVGRPGFAFHISSS